MKHAISWFEIPTQDLDRAQRFYETIFDIKMVPLDLPGFQMRLFPIDDPMEGIGGTLVHTSPGFYRPSETDGPLVYLNANPEIQTILDRVVAAGGRILTPKTQISEDYGYMAVLVDSEGNRIALHSVSG
jgi:predicted enzyme related to lactoylglutathione lyase